MRQVSTSIERCSRDRAVALVACACMSILASGCRTREQAPVESSTGTAHEYTRLDRPDLQRLFFHPRKESGRPIEPETRQITLKAQDGTRLTGRLHTAGPKAPLILAFYGNGELAEDYEAVGVYYRSKGISLLVFDYRGYGRSAGTPTVTDIMSDARWILSRLGEIEKEQDLQPVHRFVLGRSIGSAPAIDVASVTRSGLDGLILDSAFADTLPLLRVLGFTDEQHDFDEKRDGLGNLEKIAEVSVPVLLIHGEEDRIIPIRQAERLLAATRSRPRRLVRIPRAGHNNLMNIGTAAYFGAIQEMVRK